MHENVHSARVETITFLELHIVTDCSRSVGPCVGEFAKFACSV